MVVWKLVTLKTKQHSTVVEWILFRGYIEYNPSSQYSVCMC